jgi:hypothetical protein
MAKFKSLKSAVESFTSDYGQKAMDAIAHRVESYRGRDFPTSVIDKIVLAAINGVYARKPKPVAEHALLAFVALTKEVTHPIWEKHLAEERKTKTTYFFESNAGHRSEESTEKETMSAAKKYLEEHPASVLDVYDGAYMLYSLQKKGSRISKSIV